LNEKKHIFKRKTIILFCGFAAILIGLIMYKYISEYDYRQLSKSFYNHYISLADNIYEKTTIDICIDDLRNILMSNESQETLETLENTLLQIKEKVPISKYYYYSKMENKLNDIKILYNYITKDVEEVSHDDWDDFSFAYRNIRRDARTWRDDPSVRRW